MGLVHAQYGIVLSPFLLRNVLWPSASRSRRQTNRQTAVQFAFSAGRGKGGGGVGAVCVDCQLTCHMLEILGGMRCGGNISCSSYEYGIFVAPSTAAPRGLARARQARTGTYWGVDCLLAMQLSACRVSVCFN
ncbi:hypothetical protein ACLKA7_003723 [Drosophila subpalustris]